LGIEGTADRIGLAAVGVAGAAIAAHAAVSAIKQARSKTRNDKLAETEE
jgi:hydrogenase small subunit